MPLAQVRNSDGCELTGLRGPMVLSAEIGGGALLSIQHAGEDIAGKTIEFVGTETLEDVIVSVTTKVARVDVTVTRKGARSQPRRILVVLFPEDSTRWHHGYLAYNWLTTSPDSSSGERTSPPATTQLARLVPGRYLVAAIEDADIINPTEPGLLEALRPLAVPVTLVAGQTAELTVDVATIPR